MKILISSEYVLTISGHVTVLRQWLSEKNTDYIINNFFIAVMFAYWSHSVLSAVCLSGVRISDFHLLKNHRMDFAYSSLVNNIIAPWIVGILLDRSWSYDAVKITVLGVQIRIGRVILFETGDKQSKLADDELVAMDLS